MPGARFSAQQKDEALALLKERANNPLTAPTIAEIARRTGIAQPNLSRWALSFQEIEDGLEELGSRREELDSRRRKVPQKKKLSRKGGGSKDEIDYKAGYELQRLRNDYLVRGFEVPEKSRKDLEIAFLRDVLRGIYQHEVPPLFTSHAKDVQLETKPPKKRRSTSKK